MTHARQHLRAWLELFRISNLPTVISNAIAGAALGASVASRGGAATIESATAASPTIYDLIAPLLNCVTDPSRSFVLLTPVLGYIAGMALNDAFDARIDAHERAQRPIPRGHVRRAHAFVAGFALLTLSVALAASSSSMPALIAAIVLATLVVLYNVMHTRRAWSTLLLAMCRANASLITMLAFAGDDWRAVFFSGVIVLPIMLALWTLALSIVARREVDVHAIASSTTTTPLRTMINVGFGATGVIVTATMLLFIPQRATLDAQRLALAVVAVAIGVIMTVVIVRARRWIAASPSSTPRAIAAWIACLAWIDALAMACAGLPAFAAVCLVCFVATRVTQRFVAGS